MTDNGYDRLEYHCKFKADRLKEDWDWWTINSGSEGVGKSTGAIWDGFLTSEDTFSIKDCICYDPEEFLRLVDDSPRYGTIILDEAGEAWFNRDFATQTNKALAKASQQMRDRNLNVILCVPYMLLLDKVALIRHRTWVFNDAPQFRRGRAEFMEPHWKKYGGESLPYWSTRFYFWFLPLPQVKYAYYKELKSQKSKERLAQYRDEIMRKKEKYLDERPDPDEIIERILKAPDKDKYLNQRMRYDTDLVREDLHISDPLARTVCKRLNKL